MRPRGTPLPAPLALRRLVGIRSCCPSGRQGFLRRLFLCGAGSVSIVVEAELLVEQDAADRLDPLQRTQVVTALRELGLALLEHGDERCSEAGGHRGSFAAPAVLKQAGPIEVLYWGAFSGALGESEAAIVQMFNDSQPDVRIVYESQNDYETLAQEGTPAATPTMAGACCTSPSRSASDSPTPPT